MNSEELEQSLRTEFENYLKDVVAEMRQSVSDFQEKITADFDKHKEQLAESLRELDEKFDGDKELEVSFSESVTEHLKLAKDEGARITATAIAEAEKLEEPAEEGPDFENLSQAIDDISAKDSQSEILKALVNHASEYTPRGAFFIVKNEHLVGWRVFGREDHEDPKAVREVFFPVASNTALSSSVKDLSTVSSTQADSEDDVMYRNKLGFENPDNMYAVPLVARGRGVAVLYADSGSEGESVNIGAIESLMRVAGLTVEVLAGAPQVARPKPEESDVVAEEVEETSEASPVVEEAPDAPVEAGFESEYSEEPEAVEESSESEVEEESEFQPVAPVAAFDAGTDIPEPTYEEEAVEEPAAEADAGDYSFDSPAAEYEVPSFDEGSADEVEEYPVAEEAESWDASESAEESDQGFTPDESYSADESFTPDESFSSEYQPPDTDEFEAAESSSETFEAYQEEVDEDFSAPVAEPESYEFESAEDESEFESPEVEAPSFESPADDVSSFESPAEEASSFDSPAEDVSNFESPAEDVSSFESPAEDVSSFDSPAEDVSSFEEAQEDAPAFEESTSDFSFEQPADEPVVEEVEVEAAEVEEQAPAPPVRSRFADRNLDLPIEVSEDERRLHNDARRFARLLVSEIKLYNEQKVKEGRESSDLYERLREAIDRSREMYDKRVQPPVAAKFDYFNYELVNTLAEGDEGKLGGSYPGARV